MTRLRFLYALVLPAALLANGHESPKLTATESELLVSSLHQTQINFLTKIATLSDKQFNFKPAADRWSAAEIAEHLFLAENAFHQFIDATLAEEANPDWASATKGQTEKITQLVPDRSQKATAPDSLTPTGKMSRAGLVNGLTKARAETVERASDLTLPYKAHVSSNPVFGQVHAGHWLHFAALHMIRHTEQLDEVLADANFPN